MPCTQQTLHKCLQNTWTNATVDDGCARLSSTHWWPVDLVGRNGYLVRLDAPAPVYARTVWIAWVFFKHLSEIHSEITVRAWRVLYEQWLPFGMSLVVIWYSPQERENIVHEWIHTDGDGGQGLTLPCPLKYLG